MIKSKKEKSNYNKKEILKKPPKTCKNEKNKKQQKKNNKVPRIPHTKSF
jgi:hypothetical protein